MPLHLKAKHRRQIVLATAAVLVSSSAVFAVKHLPKADPKPASVTAATVGDLRAREAELTTTAQAPETKAPAAARQKVEVYKVQPGDTAGAIAEQYSLKTDTILMSNGLGDDDVISVGQELMIPVVDGVVVELKSGDTLWQLAQDYSVSELEIAEANKDVDPNSLQPGQKMVIPGAKVTAVRRQVASRSGAGARPENSRKLSFWPAVGPITDKFGWRIHPVYGSSNFHDGMDVYVPSGTPLRAAAAGEVVMAGRYGGYGLVVRIDHGGVMTQYAHLSSIGVTVGQEVGAGENIGYSGNTGVTTGPHLHFMVIVGGSPTDPAPWLP